MLNKDKCMLLIALECRLSMSSVCKLFNISLSKLTELINSEALERPLSNALIYLFYYETVHETPEEYKKSQFLARFLINKMNKILSNPDPKQRKEDFQKFYNELYGPTLDFLDKPYTLWTNEEKIKLAKYRLKYAISPDKIQDKGIVLSKSALYKLRERLEDETLKRRLRTLDEYLLARRDFLYEKNNFGRGEK